MIVHDDCTTFLMTTVILTSRQSWPLSVSELGHRDSIGYWLLIIIDWRWWRWRWLFQVFVSVLRHTESMGELEASRDLVSKEVTRLRWIWWSPINYGHDDDVFDNYPRSRDSKAEDSEGCRLQLNSLLYLRFLNLLLFIHDLQFFPTLFSFKVQKHIYSNPKIVSGKLLKPRSIGYNQASVVR